VPAPESGVPRPCPALGSGVPPPCPAPALHPPEGRAGQAAVRGAEPASWPGGRGEGALQRRLDCGCELNGAQGEEVGFQVEEGSSHCHIPPAVAARPGTGEQVQMNLSKSRLGLSYEGSHIQATGMAQTNSGTRCPTPAACGYVDESPQAQDACLRHWSQMLAEQGHQGPYDCIHARVSETHLYRFVQH